MTRAVGRRSSRRSCRRAVVRAPSCPAATRSRGCPAGATTTRSRRCRAPRWTARAATRSRTPPRRCRGSTTVSARLLPRPPRSSRGSTTVRVPVPRASTRGRTTTRRVPARVRRRAAVSSSARTSSVRRILPAPARTRSVGGQYNRQDPAATGQFWMPGYDGGSTGQYAAPGRNVQQDSGQFPAPGNGERQGGGTGQFERPAPTEPRHPPSVRSRVGVPRSLRSPRPCRPRRVPATAVRRCTTPWRRTGSTRPQGGNGNGAQEEQAPQQPAPAPAAPQRPAPAASGSSSWRTTPNDELGRQAERVRQPTAGGVTVSGLPRRVPRANLVAGTAQQQQQHQTGPQVSRSPDDVRGRLTNLRRGIQQGRQAGTGQTGSFPSPTHQQER